MLTSRNGEKCQSIYGILRQIYREDGMRGIFAGFIPRIMWITIGGAIFFGCYDLATRILITNLTDKNPVD